MKTNDSTNFTLEEYLLLRRGPKHLSLSLVVPITIVYAGIFVTGVIGNIAVCSVIARNPSMHTPTNYYLFSLAVSDLSILLLGLPNDLSVYWQQYPWALGEALCKFRAMVSEMTSYTSVLTIVAFSMERYLAICHPLHSYTMTGLKRTVKIIALLWVVALVGASPFAIFTTVNYIDYPPGSGAVVEESAFCAMLVDNLPPNMPIYELSGILFFFFPISIIAVLYAMMGWRIRERNRHSLGRKVEGAVHGESCHSQSKRSVTRMLSAVVLAFFLCWAPFHMQRLLYLYGRHSPHFPVINEWMYYITGCFYYFSSTINPILYNLMSVKYRAAFRQTLCGGRTKVPRELHSSFRDTVDLERDSVSIHRNSTWRHKTKREVNHTSSEEVIVMVSQNHNSKDILEKETCIINKQWPKTHLKVTISPPTEEDSEHEMGGVYIEPTPTSKLTRYEVFAVEAETCI